ncbi:MAG: PQQ-binding-like beta-propeller repeat protein, partial [Verrucomicrobia bacterium]|nr:PQQ-binding-like beta-propeller repeat protein [Verrucomicrobiota bacterium]
MINSGNLVRICLVTVVYGFHFLYSPLFADDRPQWGSKHVRNMISSETDLPSYFNLETGENILWKADVGFRTYATPVVAGGKVFIGTNNERPRDPRRDDDLGVLMCFDEDNGGFLWQLPVPKRESDPFLDWPRTGASSPPTVESNRVYFVDNRGNVLCLDINGMKDGNDGAFQDEAAYYTPAGDEPVGIIEADADIIWMFNPADEAGVHQHDAAHCSILLDGRFLYVNTPNGVDNRHRSVPAPGAP